jgi:hypothetical protein
VLLSVRSRPSNDLCRISLTFRRERCCHLVLLSL